MRTIPVDYTVKEAAELLGHKESTVRNLIGKGSLGHHRCPGLRVSEEQIEEYLKETKMERRTPEPRKSKLRRPILRHIKL